MPWGVRFGSSRQASASRIAQHMGADAVWSGRLAVVREPDGSSTGAVLKLSHQQAEYEVRVNWYTGGVDIFAEQAQ